MIDLFKKDPTKEKEKLDKKKELLEIQVLNKRTEIDKLISAQREYIEKIAIKKKEETTKLIQLKELEIEKLKEEIRKMAKLRVVDGKLVEVNDNVPQQAAPQSPAAKQMRQEPQQIYQEPVQQRPAYTPQEVARQAQPEIQQPRPVKQPTVIPYTEYDNDPNYPQEEVYQEMVQQPQRQVPQMQRVQRPQIQQQEAPQEIQVVNFELHMSNDKIFTVPVALQEADEMARKIIEAIDNQSSLMVGTKGINGRYIITFDLSLE
jgi:hypothetical protein